MKYIVLLGDGMADYPLDALAGKTPIEAARTPCMDEVVARGCTGLFCPIPEGMPPGSDIGNLSVFGYDPRQAFFGRAGLEAANQGVRLADNEVAFRCNLVTLDNGVMRDFTSGHIATEEASPLIQDLSLILCHEFPITFHVGVSYRHTGVIQASSDCSVQDMLDTVCEPPHNVTDREYAPYLPCGPASQLLCEIMDASQEVLRHHPVNEARMEAGKSPATSLWPWGQGRAPAMQAFKQIFGMTGAVISAVDLVKGIGVCAGMEVIFVPGATGWIDTNYEGKVAAAQDALNRHDFVYLHVEAPDETSHQGRLDLKTLAIEDFDKRVVGPFLRYLDRHPDARVLVAPDHHTLISTKTHAGGPVPFAACGAGVAVDDHSLYSESEARRSGVVVPEGYLLTRHFLTDARFHPAAFSFPGERPQLA